MKPLSDAVTLNSHLRKSQQGREVLTIDSKGLADTSRAERQDSREALNDRSDASRIS